MRVWIYPAHRRLNKEEVKAIMQKAETFLNNWGTHGRPLSASFEIKDNYFLVLSVDEAQVSASGCSIDESVRFIKSLEAEFGLPLFDRQIMDYRTNGEVLAASLKDIPELYKKGKITEDTHVFNPTVTSVEEMRERWEIPFGKSGYRMFV